ncbi:tryptophan-rich sensory protein [Patescibacteria group bacterium]|nr:MAG: tryptophan-rich sensory protein [Patescibacteria group bacterium]
MLTKSNFVIVTLVFLTALAGSLVTARGMDWYRTIQVPAWTPGGNVIGTVWTVLFVLAAVSIIVYWTHARRGREFRRVIGGFVVNGLLNVGWSVTFFGLHLVGPAVLVSAALAANVAWLIWQVRPTSRAASWLLAPYFAWVCFATYLTFAIWRPNG